MSLASTSQDTPAGPLGGPADTALAVAINTMPIGSIICHGASTPPDGWLLCNGDAIIQAQYPNLFALIGNTLPDLRSRFVVGTGAGPGLSPYAPNNVGGAETVALSIGQIPAHQHFGIRTVGNSPFGTLTTEGTESMAIPGGLGFLFFGSSMEGEDKGHDNLPPFWALTYIIKY